ncbi:hypothetical protein HNR72_005866 [Streptomyces collinus]|uniref:Uncharacterized protein n=1 Tax=Streptomyces collinus TaxID=42684 RepID=A0AA89Q9N0_STRCU|nr:hypothetical protein [Streptomyces collinus]
MERAARGVLRAAEITGEAETGTGPAFTELGCSGRRGGT